MNKNIKILVTNDDGIYAPGIKLLEEMLAKIGYTNINIVAPLRDQSGVGASFSYARPVSVEHLTQSSDNPVQSWAVEGTPVDCIKLALSVLFKNDLPDLVISGINNGSNAGRNTMYSGTVNAALEARIKGIPSIALSQVSKIDYLQSETAANYLKIIIKYILEHSLPKEHILNINFPLLEESASYSGIKFTEQGNEIIVEDPRYMGIIKNKSFYTLGALIYKDSFSYSEEYQFLSEKYITAALVSTFNMSLSTFSHVTENIADMKKHFYDFMSLHLDSFVNQN